MFRRLGMSIEDKVTNGHEWDASASVPEAIGAAVV